MKLVVNMTVPFVIMGAMVGLLFRWAIQNKRVGYRRPILEPLITEGLRTLGDLKDALTDKEPPKQPVPAAPVAGPTPVEQLVALSLAVQDANPVEVGAGNADKGQQSEPNVSAEEQLAVHSTEKLN